MERSVEDWCKEIELPEIIDKLKKECSVSSPTDLMNLSNDDMNDVIQICGLKLGKKGKFLKAIEDLKARSIKETVTPATAPVKTIPLSDAKFLKKLGGIDLYLYHSRPFVGLEGTGARTLIVVGQTGSGKTTHLNSMINYLCGVQFEDTFRYVIVQEDFNKSQAHSQTSDVTSYYIRSHLPGVPPVILIDSPGFGDTRGLDQDKKITQQIGSFFKTKINSIDVIAFVAQSSLARLTASQKYIFNSILQLFGKDIKDNIILMLTFADGNEPQVLTAMKEDNVPFVNFFKFNNSAVFNSMKDSFNKLFWEMGMQGFQDMFKMLPTIKTKSLVLTNEVLKHRQSLENNVVAIRPQIDEGLNKLEEMNSVITTVKSKKDEVNASKNFNFESTITVYEVINLPSGVHTTTCMKCNRTCHENCGIPDNNSKAGCCAISNNYCTVCPGHCYWDNHKNLPVKYEPCQKKKTVKSDDLYAKYVSASSEKSKSEQVLQGLIQDFATLQEIVLNRISDVYNSLKELQKIALVPNPLGVSDYITLMIQSEEQEKKLGWTQRRNTLLQLQENTKFLENMNQPNFDPFKNHKERIEKMMVSVLSDEPEKKSWTKWFG